MALPKVGVEAVIEGMAAFEADSKKVNKSLGKMDDSIGLLSKTSISLGSSLTKLGGTILKLGAVASGAGILAIGAGLFKAAQAGLSMNDAMEQASAKINAFTKDGAKTAEILEMIRDRASRTPFEFQEMANAAAGLLPASKQAGIGLEAIIEQAEILAASNPAEGLEGAAFALREAVSGDFTSIIERFNLPRTMINQLKEEGLPNLEIVSRAMQELGFDTDLVSALAETAQGRWSTFKDTLTNMAATATQPIFTAFSQGLGDINGWLTANEPMLTAMANILANQVATALTTVGTEAVRLFAIFQSGGTEGLFTALGLGSLVTMWATVQPILSQLITWLGTNLPTAFNTLSAVAMSFMNVIMTNVWPQLQEAFANITQALNNMGLTWGDVFTALGTAAKIVASVIGLAILAIIGTITGLVTGFASAFATISSYFTDFQDAIGLFVSGISQLFTGMITIISGLLIGDLGMVFEGVKQQISGLFDAIKGLGSFLLTAMQASLGGVFSFVRGWMSSFLGFFDGLAPALGDKFENTWEAIREIWKPEKWFELGESVITGILEGIKENQDKVLEMLKSMAADALQAAKDAIGFGSPATEFMPIGESMIQGMLLGAEKEGFAKKFVDDLDMGGIARKLGTGGSGWKELRRIIGRGIGANFGSLISGNMSPADIINQIQQTAARFNFPPSFVSEFAQANGLIEHLNSSVAEFQEHLRAENMGRLVQMGGQLSSLGGTFAEMLGPVMDKNLERIQLFQDFLSGKTQGRMFAHPLTGVLEEMVVFQQDGLEVAINRSLAQRELNKLLQEQRKQEELITQQKEAQQKLGFLQAQLDLIKLGKELGGNIFQGITFGLNANVTDLLAATNNVVEAMIGQINSDLQIASPSKVMARIGQQMMAGLQGGIASMTPVLNAQLSASVMGPLSPSMAGAMNSSSYSTTNNFNVGGNNISNGMQAAEFEARVLHVIRSNL